MIHRDINVPSLGAHRPADPKITSNASSRPDSSIFIKSSQSTGRPSKLNPSILCVPFISPVTPSRTLELVPRELRLHRVSSVSAFPTQIRKKETTTRLTQQQASPLPTPSS
jgi:hypothetical protein